MQNTSEKPSSQVAFLFPGSRGGAKMHALHTGIFYQKKLWIFNFKNYLCGRKMRVLEIRLSSIKTAFKYL